jgi:hypothetical protein
LRGLETKERGPKALFFSRQELAASLLACEKTLCGSPKRIVLLAEPATARRFLGDAEDVSIDHVLSLLLRKASETRQLLENSPWGSAILQDRSAGELNRTSELKKVPGETSFKDDELELTQGVFSVTARLERQTVNRRML